MFAGFCQKVVRICGLSRSGTHVLATAHLTDLRVLKLKLLYNFSEKLQTWFLFFFVGQRFSGIDLTKVFIFVVLKEGWDHN